MKLHIGCGLDTKNGWTNLDITPGAGVDIVANLDTDTIPLPDNSVEEILGLHVIEHLHNPLHAMSELYRIAKPDALMTLACPYGSSDDAWEDPTHVRPYFVGSWSVFGQPYYWRADYGYRADWQIETVMLQLDRRIWATVPAEDAAAAIHTQRNIVHQQVAILSAIKPTRARERALLEQPDLRLQLVDIT